jgi:hypothetical protein
MIYATVVIENHDLILNMSLHWLATAGQGHLRGALARIDSKIKRTALVAALTYLFYKVLVFLKVIFWQT